MYSIKIYILGNTKMYWYSTKNTINNLYYKIYAHLKDGLRASLLYILSHYYSEKKMETKKKLKKELFEIT